MDKDLTSRTALDAAEKVEPVAWWDADANDVSLENTDGRLAPLYMHHQAITQEPDGFLCHGTLHRVKGCEECVPLYAAPTPPTNTDESLVQLAKRLAEVIEERDELREAARAVVEQWLTPSEITDDEWSKQLDRLRKAL